MQSKQEALKEARAARRMMDNPRAWKINVFENMGWFWTLDCGNLSLHGKYYEYSEKWNFFTLLSDGQYKGCGEMYWSPDNRSFTNPQKAVNYQMRVAEKFIVKVSGVVDKINQKLAR